MNKSPGTMMAISFGSKGGLQVGAHLMGLPSSLPLCSDSLSRVTKTDTKRGGMTKGLPEDADVVALKSESLGAPRFAALCDFHD